MSKKLNLAGQRFGRLVAIEPTDKRSNRSIVWLCKCDCGNTAYVGSSNLKSGHTKSCGCLKKEKIRDIGKQYGRNVKHNGSYTRLYRIWAGMKMRCHNEKEPGYKWYGAQGIFVCESWKNNFETFQSWALTNGYRDDLSIDRINNDGPYSPENCRWATAQQQTENRRPYTRNPSVYPHYEINGISLTAKEWAKRAGITKKAFCTRWERGDRGADLLRPMNTTAKQKEYDPTKYPLYEIMGQKRTAKQWSEISGLKKETILDRWSKGDRGMDVLRPLRSPKGETFPAESFRS